MNSDSSLNLETFRGYMVSNNFFLIRNPEFETNRYQVTLSGSVLPQNVGYRDAKNSMNSNAGTEHLMLKILKKTIVEC